MKAKTLVAAFAFAAGAALADTTPVMVSLVNPVQAPGDAFEVEGFRLSLIYGACSRFTGLDIGVAGYSAGDFTGIAVGGVNVARGRLLGGQIGLVNWNCFGKTSWNNRPYGAQIGLVNYAEELGGHQFGAINVSGRSMTGLQYGFVNCTDELMGVQMGFEFLFGVNVAGGNVRGLQVGLVNYADTMEKGLQIGILNIISRNGWAPILPIVNGCF